MKTKILFVEDYEPFLESIQESLEEEGYDVLPATNVSDAIELFVRNSDIKLVLTDLSLPEYLGSKHSGEVGLRFVDSLKLRNPNLPVIVITAYLDPYTVEVGSLGISAVIPKGTQDQNKIIKTAIQKLLNPSYSADKKSTNVSFESFRGVLIAEMDKLTPIKARTIFIPEEGQFELIKPLVGFKNEIENQLTKFPYAKNVFLMMKFRSSNKDLSEYIIENLADHGLKGVRADQNEWNITKNVYNPIAALYCCKYGIALFDEPEDLQAYNPNVAYELGMMHYQNKNCLILRHNTLPPAPFDLIKDLYITYEKELQMRSIIADWIKQIA